jgi:hypothetical protein
MILLLTSNLFLKRFPVVNQADWTDRRHIGVRRFNINCHKRDVIGRVHLRLLVFLPI